MKLKIAPWNRYCALAALWCAVTLAAHAQQTPTAATPVAATVAAPTQTATTSAAQTVPAEAAAVPAQQACPVLRTFDWINAETAKLNENYGIDIIFDYEADILGNPVGGLTRGAAYSQTIEYGFTLDLEKIAKIQGASFTVTGLTTGVSNLSNKIGNVFTAAQTFVGNGSYLYEVYWQQMLCDKKLQIQAGRLNTNNFATLPAFDIQVSGGVNGNPTSLFLNTNFLSMPNAVWGANATATVSDNYYIAGGLYQAAIEPGKHNGTDLSFTGNCDGVFMLAETGWAPTFGTTAEDELGLPGIYKMGGYTSTAPYQYFDGSGTKNLTYGFYWMAQQMVWRSDSNENNNFSLWGGLTWSPQQSVAEMPIMGFAGFVWQGLIPNRDQDQLLGAVMAGGFSSDYAQANYNSGGGYNTTETVFDVSYVITINKNFFVQPDIQYIIRPSGLSNTQNALVIGLQFGISL